MPPKRKATAPASTTAEAPTSKLSPKNKQRTAKPKSKTTKLPRAAKDVLNSENLTDEAAAGLQANRDNCALLRMLPPEIRNKIWEDVLGGKTIHIKAERQQIQLTNDLKLQRYVCKRGSTEEADADANKAANGSTTFESHFNCHKKCFRAPTKKKMKNGRYQKKPKPLTMNLGLLATCREIHNEACLIPYTHNTFSFDYIVNLHAFMERLVHTQVKAVQHITFVYKESFAADSYLEKRLQEKFVGLKSLVFLIPDPLNHRILDLHEKCMLRFQRLDISSAKVAGWTTDAVVSEQQLTKMRTWEEGVEKKLVADFDAEQAVEEYFEYDEDAMLMEEFAEYY